MATIACSKDYSIVVAPQDCPDWDSVIWTGTPGNPPPENVFQTTGVVTRTFIGGQFQIGVHSETGTAYYADALGTLAYAGTGCNCNASITCTIPVSGEGAETGFQILQDATVLVNFRWMSLGSGVGLHVDVPFSLAASAGSSITIRGRWQPIPAGPRAYTYISAQSSFSAYQVAITNL